jgi:hypothetical protein
LGSLPATLEGSRNIFVAVVATQREPDSAINDFGISRGGIIISEQTGVRRDSKPALAEHHKDALSVEIALGLKWNNSQFR